MRNSFEDLIKSVITRKKLDDATEIAGSILVADMNLPKAAIEKLAGFYQVGTESAFDELLLKVIGLHLLRDWRLYVTGVLYLQSRESISLKEAALFLVQVPITERRNLKELEVKAVETAELVTMDERENFMSVDEDELMADAIRNAIAGE